MITAPCPNIPKAEWMKKITWETSSPFRIEWISKSHTYFWKFGDIINPLNDGSLIFVGRDGQEYSGESARQMITIMNMAADRYVNSSTRIARHDKNKQDRRLQFSANPPQSLKVPGRLILRGNPGFPVAKALQWGLDSMVPQADMTLIDY